MQARRTGMTRADEDALSVGVYTVPQAARLVQERHQRVRGWVVGYPNVKADPIIKRQLDRVGGKDTLGFLDLMEVRFIRYFAVEYGLKVRSLRRAFQNARRVLGHDHPFATRAIRFRTDTKKIFVESLEQESEPRLYDLMSNNFSCYDVVVESLSETIEFSESGEAAAWRPNPREFELILLNPKYSFGQPIVSDSAVPTRALKQMYDFERSYDAVVDWFEVRAEEARQGVEFEKQLAAA